MVGPLLPGDFSQFIALWNLLTSSLGLAILAACAAIRLLLPLLYPQKAAAMTKKAAGPSAQKLMKPAPTDRPKVRGSGKAKSSSASAWDGPNLQGTFIPTTGLLEGNPPSGYRFESEHCRGLFLPMHRPTFDRALDKSGDFRYGNHFKGRKRLWEMRLQMQMKRDVAESMRFGIELEQYVPLNAATKRLMGITVAALRQVAGSDLYHSPGDDPAVTPLPHEKPVFSMPLWAFDQFIVTPEGESPPDLTDECFSDFGCKRTDDRSAFVKQMSGLHLRAGPTYTFAFWGISQFLDDIKWEVQKVIPFKAIDFDLFCGAPPVQLVLYTLKDDGGAEPRHLESRKNYFFRLAFWSSLRPPNPERLRQLLPKDDYVETAVTAEVSRKRKGWSHRFTGIFACCAEQRG